MSNFKILYLGIFLNKQKIVQELKHLQLMSKEQTAKPGLHRKVHFMNNQNLSVFNPLFEVKNILLI